MSKLYNGIFFSFFLTQMLLNYLSEFKIIYPSKADISHCIVFLFMSFGRTLLSVILDEMWEFPVLKPVTANCYSKMVGEEDIDCQMQMAQLRGTAVPSNCLETVEFLKLGASIMYCGALTSGSPKGRTY